MAAKKKATEEVKAALPLEELAVTEEKPSAPSRTRKAVKKAAEERPEWEERPVALKEQAPEKQQVRASEDEQKAVSEKKESEAPAAKPLRKRGGKKPAQEKKAEESLAPAEEEPVPPAAEETAAEKAEKPVLKEAPAAPEETSESVKPAGGGEKEKKKAFSRRKKQEKVFDAPLERVEADPEVGLSEAQALERAERGLNNEQPNIVTKSYLNIFRSNVITLFNGLNFLLAALILVYGSIKNMTFIILVICNMVVGIVQEIRSKLVLEKMSLLNVPKVSVIRGGEKKQVDMSDIVIDDIIEIHAGEQIASDSVVVSGECEVNESMLTGEQDDIHKTQGAELLSGSVVQAGSCRARVVKVGKDNFAATILSEAKKYKKSKSQLMRSINWIIRIVTIAIFPMGILMYLTNCADRGVGFAAMFNITSSDMAEKVSSVITNTVASVVGMIPEGLVMMTSIALAVGVIKLARKQTLVQDLYSIETLARVDMLCLDKTGTITEGSMQVESVHVYTDKFGGVTDIMTSMVAALGASGSTFEAFAAYFKGETVWTAESTVPFSSARKWSGADFGEKGRFIVGAPEFVLKERYNLVQKDVEEYTKRGFRVLVLAYSPLQIKENVREDKLKPVALLVLSDKIRASAGETLRYFAEQGVEIKIISGDNPITVSKVAERAGVKGFDSYIDATTLLTEEDVLAACDKYTIFGRVTPKQKKLLVQGLKAKGHTVGMTGDGVNDVMALKEADWRGARGQESHQQHRARGVPLPGQDDVQYAAFAHVHNFADVLSLRTHSAHAHERAVCRDPVLLPRLGAERAQGGGQFPFESVLEGVAGGHDDNVDGDHIMPALPRHRSGRFGADSDHGVLYHGAKFADSAFAGLLSLHKAQAADNRSGGGRAHLCRERGLDARVLLDHLAHVGYAHQADNNDGLRAAVHSVHARRSGRDKRAVSDDKEIFRQRIYMGKKYSK